MTENKIREHRERLGLTQSEVARRAGVANQNLSAVERGNMAAWPKLRRSLARILKTTQAELFPETEGKGDN